MGVAFQLNISYSIVDPDYYKLYELLFPWFCGFVKRVQWPNCNPWLFTFQQISSYWNHVEGRAGVKGDSHAPYLYKTNTCLTQNPHLCSNIKSLYHLPTWDVIINYYFPLVKKKTSGSYCVLHSVSHGLLWVEDQHLLSIPNLMRWGGKTPIIPHKECLEERNTAQKPCPPIYPLAVFSPKPTHTPQNW